MPKESRVQQERRAQLAQLDLKAFKESRAQQVHKVKLDLKVLQDRLAKQDHKVLQARLVQLESKDLLVPLAHKVLLAQLVFKVQQEIQDHKVRLVHKE